MDTFCKWKQCWKIKKREIISNSDFYNYVDFFWPQVGLTNSKTFLEFSVT